jgi:hypothetical protein
MHTISCYNAMLSGVVGQQGPQGLGASGTPRETRLKRVPQRRSASRSHPGGKCFSPFRVFLKQSLRNAGFAVYCLRKVR